MSCLEIFVSIIDDISFNHNDFRITFKEYTMYNIWNITVYYGL